MKMAGINMSKKRVPGAKPTPEQIARIEAAKKLPIVYPKFPDHITMHRRPDLQPAAGQPPCPGKSVPAF